ncbi:hypothetical protein [Nocardiopsis alkaliphila]|uniref:hypothetical protein n=1 Tax=Nocardiopsis alkaliphila TaxID=225762 RepID=UPI00034D3F27|nr:hypothetical protein [Nocardiopsis alkaliphila]
MTERLVLAVSACLDWAHEVEPPPPIKVEALVLLLSTHQDSGATDPGDWTIDDVHEVAALLRRHPNPPRVLRETWLSWCDHLVAEGRLTSQESPRRLRAAIEQVDLEPSTSTGPLPQAPLPQAATPLLDRLSGGTGPFPHLPASPIELDTRARACRTLERAARLAHWLDPRRLLRSGTHHDALREIDTTEAAQALETTPADVGALFTIARAAGLVRTTYLHALPGPAARGWAEERPGAAADAWADALTTMVAVSGPTPFLLLSELFLGGRALTPPELFHVCAEPDPAAHVPRVLRALIDLDAVEVTEEGRYRITTLGDHGVARRLRACGVKVPRIPPATKVGAAGLAKLLHEVRPIDVEPLLERWLAGRDPATAAQDLLAAGMVATHHDPEDFVRLLVQEPRAATLLELVSTDTLTAPAS